MVATVRNPDIKQKDAGQAVIIAVTSHSVFESGPEDLQRTGPYGRGVAFPLLQALEKVNERLLEANPHEAMLFDVILLSTDSEDHHPHIIASTKHYGLEVGRFCFSSEEDSIETLLSNKVQLFLSTDISDVSKALQRGVASALLYQQTASHSSEQLRVLLSGVAVGLPDHPRLRPPGCRGSQLHPKAAQDSIQEFSSQLGEMRKRFGVDGSPLSISLMMEWGSMDTCGQALKTLRSWGLSVDEAYCLAGSPKGPILSLVKPHIVFTDGCYTSSPGSVQDS